MAKKRIFVSFAMEDRSLRDLFTGQRLHAGTPFEFADFSVKQPWDQNWKTSCRTKIKGCDGVIALITNNTPNALGQLWEIKCAYEELIPVLLLYGYQNQRLPSVPLEIEGKMINTWTWERVETFINKV